MENDYKPEWFQMADEDRAAQIAKAPKTRKRSATLLALSAPLMILGAGLIFAQSTNVPDATAAAPSAQVQNSTISSNPSTSTSVASSQSPAVATFGSEESSEGASFQTSFQKISAPATPSTTAQPPAINSQGLVLPAVSGSAASGGDDDADDQGDNGDDDNGDGEGDDD